MRTGNSAITNSLNSQFISPRIKAVLYSGMATGRTAGGSAPNWIANTVFNNYVIGLEAGGFIPVIKTYNYNAGLSNISGFTLPETVFLSEGKFINMGQTLSLFWAEIPGLSMIRYDTINGKSWYVGASILSNASFGNFAPVSNSEIYISEVSANDPSVDFTVPAGIGHLTISGNTTIRQSLPVINQNMYVGTRNGLNAIRGHTSNKDLVFQQYSVDAYAEPQVNAYKFGVKVLEINNKRVFKEWDLFNPRYADRLLKGLVQDNIQIGNTYSYLTASFNQYVKTQGDWAEFYETRNISKILFKIQDGKVSNPLVMSNYIKPLTDNWYFMGGNTQPEFLTFSRYEIISDSVGNDITDNIVNYTNSDNRQIDITLGNQK